MTEQELKKKKRLFAWIMGTVMILLFAAAWAMIAWRW